MSEGTNVAGLTRSDSGPGWARYDIGSSDYQLWVAGGNQGKFRMLLWLFFMDAVFRHIPTNIHGYCWRDMSAQLKEYGIILPTLLRGRSLTVQRVTPVPFIVRCNWKRVTAVFSSLATFGGTGGSVSACDTRDFNRRHTAMRTAGRCAREYLHNKKLHDLSLCLTLGKTKEGEYVITGVTIEAPRLRENESMATNWEALFLKITGQSLDSYADEMSW